jgi:putative Mn2+ efflux pump MntP
MDIMTLCAISFALALDAFAVSIASGVVIKKKKAHLALKLGTSFGLFQAVMPVLGFAAGNSMRSFIVGIDHWIAFGLLFLIGSKMVYESFQLEGVEENSKGSMSFKTLMLLSVATSIDAFAVGIMFSLLDVSILFPVLLIGCVTFLMSFSGVFIGSRAGHLFEKKAEMAAGIVLIGIGLKILIEHLV